MQTSDKPVWRCATCRHWNSVQIKDSWSVCNLADSDEGNPDHSWSLAYASDVEKYGAILNTHADFGCVQWEEVNDVRFIQAQSKT